jgi:hypothetical protein
MLQQLPSKPNLENLKKQAKSIVKSHSKYNQQRCDILRHLNRFRKLSNEEIFNSPISLSEAQFALAISYGFKSWTGLKKYVANARNLEDKIKPDNKAEINITKSEDDANKLSLFDRIAKRNSDKEEIAKEVIKNHELLSFIFEGLENKKADIKYGCEKILMIISESEPAVLYPQFDFFVSLLDHPSNFMKWGATKIIANLTQVDAENRFDKIFEKYFAPIPGPVMITAANIIGNSSKIASVKPYLTEKIVIELLKVETAEYQTTECRNIALGHFIVSVDQFFDQIKDKKPLVDLIKKQLNNTRNATKKKAMQFVKKYKL